MADDDLSDFETEEFTDRGATRTIYRSGDGPAVIVLAEIPGITPKVLRFARRVREAGFTVVLPHLFGVPGRDPDPGAHGGLAAAQTVLGSLVPACINREFTVFATGRTSPVVEWLRALGRAEHDRCGGPGVGAVGMCFTGGFALAMATDAAMLASVMSQPSLPMVVNPRDRRSIDLSRADLEIVKARCAAEDLEVIGLRFKGDRMVPAERFQFLRDELGDAFVAVELDDSAANPSSLNALHTVLGPHSVLTEQLVDEPGEPTREALDAVIELFRRKLLAG